MRLVTVNLMSARSMQGSLVDQAALKQVVADLDADVLAVQEVDRGQPRSDHRDLTAELAEAMGALDARFAPAIVGTPGGSWRSVREDEQVSPDAATYGVALVSRLPVRAWTTTPLRAAPVYGPIVAMTPKGPRVVPLKDEPRVLLSAVLETPSGPLTVASTHLSFVPGWNVRQLRLCLGALRAQPGARLLLGDLNLPGHLIGLVTRWRRLISEPTWPSDNPRIQFDHALADGPLPRVLAARTVSLPVSDHRAVVVDLDV